MISGLCHLTGDSCERVWIWAKIGIFKNSNRSPEKHFICRVNNGTLWVWVNMSAPTVSGYGPNSQFMLSVRINWLDLPKNCGYPHKSCRISHGGPRCRGQDEFTPGNTKPRLSSYCLSKVFQPVRLDDALALVLI